MNIGKRHSFQKWKARQPKKSHFWNIWEERPGGTFHVGASPVKVLFLDLQPQQDRLGFLWITVTPHFELSKFRFLLQGAYLGGQANMGALSNTKRINLNGGDSLLPVSRIHFLFSFAFNLICHSTVFVFHPYFEIIHYGFDSFPRCFNSHDRLYTKFLRFVFLVAFKTF